MFYCLMNTGGAISSRAASLLFETAKNMARATRKSAKFANDECFGVLTTKYNHNSIGTISGVEFRAELVTMGKESVVTFIVQGNWIDQEPGNWLGFEDEDAINSYAAEHGAQEKPSRLN